MSQQATAVNLHKSPHTTATTTINQPLTDHDKIHKKQLLKPIKSDIIHSH